MIISASKAGLGITMTPWHWAGTSAQSHLETSPPLWSGPPLNGVYAKKKEWQNAEDKNTREGLRNCWPKKDRPFRLMPTNVSQWRPPSATMTVVAVEVRQGKWRRESRTCKQKTSKQKPTMSCLHYCLNTLTQCMERWWYVLEALYHMLESRKEILVNHYIYKCTATVFTSHWWYQKVLNALRPGF